MHIVVFGDSITQGYDDYEKGGWVNRLFIDISAREDKTDKNYISVFNLGIDGDTTVDVLTRIESEIVARRDEEMIIVFDIGGNDAAKRGAESNVVPLNEFLKNYQKLITTAKKFGRVACLGLHESGGALTVEDDMAYNQAIEQCTKEEGVVFVSMKNMLSKDFEGLTYDGDHPSPSGHELIYKRVKESLEKVI